MPNNLAEEDMKLKRHLVRFQATRRRGPRGTTERQERLHAALLRYGSSTVSQIFERDASVAALYRIHGRIRLPQSFQDAKRDLIRLARLKLASWEPQTGARTSEQTIRVPNEFETRAGRAAGAHDWVLDGFMVESPENSRWPFRVDNLVFQRTGARPAGRAAVAKLWPCVPATHAARLEDLEFDLAARESFPTPAAVFEGLLELYRRGCVEIWPLGIADAC